MKNALYVLLGVLAGFVLAGVLIFVSRAPAGQPIVLQPAPTKVPVAVHVVGAVPRPGLYEFAEGARVQDAIDAAGGLLASANVDSINLAALLIDGDQLAIPYQEGEAPAEAFTQPELPSSTTPETASSNSQSNDVININTASLEELDSLPGIGPTIAQRIIDYRAENGPFTVIDEILNVPGIGPSTFDEIKELISV